MTQASRQTFRTVRPPAHAGRFYAQEADALARQVDDLVAAARVNSVTAKAMIVPHAGYIWSGDIAAAAYTALLPQAQQTRRIVLLGPAHTGPLKGYALPDVESFASPLGQVPLDLPVIAELMHRDDVALRPDLHANEHSLEVQLPFIQRQFPDATLVPILVGDSQPAQTATLIEQSWQDPHTLVLVSSDLSHFENDATATALDRRAADAIELLEPGRVSHQQACGHHAVRGLLQAARHHGMRATTLALKNSAAVSGDRDRVVGYGAFAFESADNARLPDHQRDRILTIVAQTLQCGVTHNKKPDLELAGAPINLRALRACFVTLRTEEGRLRGCIGSLRAHRPLLTDIVDNTYRAGFADKRFPPLKSGELSGLHLDVSIVSHSIPLTFSGPDQALAQLRPGIDGLILHYKNHTGLFLPHVWEQIGQPEIFLQQLKQKAGLAADFWSDEIKLHRFSCESFGGKIAQSAS